jgi:hypothetical protein
LVLVANPVVIEKSFSCHVLSIPNLVVIEKYFGHHPIIAPFGWQTKSIFGCHTLSDQKFSIDQNIF